MVLCSPNSARSDAVASEVEIAQSLGKLVFCVWIKGIAWAESAPFSLLPYNYTDLREFSEGTGPIPAAHLDVIIAEILEGVPEHFETEEHLQRSFIFGESYVFKLENRLFVFQKQKHNSFADILYKLYNNYLSTEYLPFSYGVDWCLVDGFKYLMPFEFLVRDLGIEDRLEVYEQANSLDWLKGEQDTFEIRATDIKMLRSHVAGFILDHSLPARSILGPKAGFLPNVAEIEQPDFSALRRQPQVCFDILALRESAREILTHASMRRFLQAPIEIGGFHDILDSVPRDNLLWASPGKIYRIGHLPTLR